MSKPTPGPWTEQDMGRVNYFAVDGADGLFVCHFDRLGKPEEAQANRDLAKAAVNACFAINPSNPQAVAEAIPELVEVAKESYLALLQGIPQDEAKWPEFVPHRKTIKKLRAVLAKVEGRETD